MTPPVRSPWRRLGELIGLVASLAVIAALVGVVILNQRGRAGGQPDGSSVPIAVATAVSSPVPSIPETPIASVEQPPPLTPTSEPSPVAGASTPHRTPRPTGDPRPEGTSHVHKASGHLGENIVNDEITIRVDPAAIPASYDWGLCARANPAYSDVLAYAITESWTRWSKVDWAFELDNEQVGSWLENPPDFGNGKSYVQVICHRPGTPTTISIYSGPLEHTDVPEDYQWTIR